MNYISINDVKEIIRRGEKKALVLIWRDTGETFGFWPENLLFQLTALAKKSVESGKFDTIEQAIAYLEKVTYICTEEDFNTNQEYSS